VRASPTAVLQRLGLRLETVKAEVERALAGFPEDAHVR
jgi:hypothetical protein